MQGRIKGASGKIMNDQGDRSSRCKQTAEDHSSFLEVLAFTPLLVFHITLTCTNYGDIGGG